MTVKAMDRDDDVEHLFSWLQTPELRYREFAGAREITDSIVIIQHQRTSNTPAPQDEPVHPPHHDARLAEEYPENQFPDQGETRVEIYTQTPHAGAGIGISTITPVPMSEPSASPAVTHAAPAQPAAGGGLLGGAYRADSENGLGSGSGEQHQSPPQDIEPRNDRALDAVFGRLAEVRSRLPDPRERLRHTPSAGPPAGRQR